MGRAGTWREGEQEEEEHTPRVMGVSYRELCLVASSSKSSQTSPLAGLLEPLFYPPF